jgi:hypothetical protein
MTKKETIAGIANEWHKLADDSDISVREVCEEVANWADTLEGDMKPIIPRKINQTHRGFLMFNRYKHLILDSLLLLSAILLTWLMLTIVKYLSI